MGLIESAMIQEMQSWTDCMKLHLITRRDIVVNVLKVSNGLVYVSDKDRQVKMIINTDDVVAVSRLTTEETKEFMIQERLLI